MAKSESELFDLSSASIQASVLDSLRIASPCPKLWSEMEQTSQDAVRFCGDCKKNVYDVSQMTTLEATLLLQKGCAQGSSVCMQLYRRADGTVITDDCPVGLRRVRDLARRLRRLAACALALVFGGIGSIASVRADEGKRADQASPEQGGRMLRGDVMSGEAVLKPTDATWEAMAQGHPEIKALMTKYQAVAAQSKCSDSDRLAMAKLNFEMAKLGDAKGVPMFAQARYIMAQKSVEAMPGQKDLLKQILTQRLKNDTTLGGGQKGQIEARLKTLQGASK